MHWTQKKQPACGWRWLGVDGMMGGGWLGGWGRISELCHCGL